MGAAKINPAPVDAVPSVWLARFLLLTAAINGAVILVVEILGAKMLAPFMGTSHFVWTAQIGVTLLSLAVGYYAGGSLVDRWPRAGLLYAAMTLASLFLCLSVLLVRPVCFFCLDLGDLAVGALLASVLLYFVPLALLAMTVPFLSRMLTDSVSRVGGQVGRLSALSTLGSVAGTSLIGYVLLPRVSNSTTMFAAAAVLLLLAAGYALIWGRAGRSAVAGAAVFALLLAYAGWKNERAAMQSDSRRILYHANSNFGELMVSESANYYMVDGENGGPPQPERIPWREYVNDYLVQNNYDPEIGKSLSLFTSALYGLPQVYTPATRDVLCIGMGVGVVPMRFATDGARTDVVEINPQVVPLAQAYFHFRPEQVGLHIGDGRQFLNRTTNTYDAIVLDAFLGDSTPSHLMTLEAFAAMRERLRPDGVLVINSFGRGLDDEEQKQADAGKFSSFVFDRAEDYLTASLHKTLAKVFGAGGVRIHSSGNGNVFFVAARAGQLTAHRAPDFASTQPAANVFASEHPLLLRSTHRINRPEWMYKRVWTVAPGMGDVLTDDFNPVEFHDAKNRQRTRLHLAGSMRQRQ